MQKQYSSWLFLFLKGLILIVIGGVFVYRPLDAAKLTAEYIGVLLILGGLIAAYNNVKLSRVSFKNFGFSASILSVAIGLFLLFFSNYALMLFALCIGLWVLVDGVNHLSSAKTASKIDLNFGRWLSLFGILSLLIAVVIFINPEGLIAFLTAFLGIILLFSGLFLSLVGLRLRR